MFTDSLDPVDDFEGCSTLAFLQPTSVSLLLASADPYSPPWVDLSSEVIALAAVVAVLLCFSVVVSALLVRQCRRANLERVKVPADDSSL
jgi:hypothetical protein